MSMNFYGLKGNEGRGIKVRNEGAIGSEGNVGAKVEEFIPQKNGETEMVRGKAVEISGHKGIVSGEKNSFSLILRE